MRTFIKDQPLLSAARITYCWCSVSSATGNKISPERMLDLNYHNAFSDGAPVPTLALMSFSSRSLLQNAIRCIHIS